MILVGGGEEQATGGALLIDLMAGWFFGKRRIFLTTIGVNDLL